MGLFGVGESDGGGIFVKWATGCQKVYGQVGGKVG